MHYDWIILGLLIGITFVHHRALGIYAKRVQIIEECLIKMMKIFDGEKND